MNIGTTIASNSLRYLSEHLADDISKSNQDLFSKTVIVTQSAGMDAWLKTELAKHNRIFANFLFLNQDGLFGEVHRILFEKKLKNNSDTLKYMVYECLGKETFCKAFPETADYYKNNDQRRIQLAGRVADLLDQYQLYRPEMLDTWEKGKLSTEDKQGNELRINSEKWQQWIWNDMKIESKLSIRERIRKELEADPGKIRTAMPDISVFGISVFTEFHREFISSLEKYVKVNIYSCLPTGTEDHKNDLLLSLGSKARELTEMTGKYSFTPVESRKDTILGRLQNQVLDNNNETIGPSDDSIQVNSCYTQAREAECLYNFLLDLFSNTSPELKPEEVLVLASDINAYAPYIKAVFRNAQVKIPFQVSGAASALEDSIVSALELIMNFSEDEMSSEKVIGMLEHNRIKKRFRIESTDYIRAVVLKANIRYGRENDAENDTAYVSWSYGLKKLLLGYAMLSDERYDMDDDLSIFPFRDSEASQSYDLLRLNAYIQVLEEILDDENETKTLKEWKKWFFEDVIENLVFRDDFSKEDREEMKTVYKALSFTEQLVDENKVPYPVFLEALQSRLFAETGEFKINTGRVTVSSPIPVRGLPYKVVCFIGLNNDIFPRRDKRMGFDLIREDDDKKEIRRGDRNQTETDKLLFSETLLAAEDKLYLSYIGQSEKDNKEIPMSTVCDTLINHLCSDDILFKHPLHGFSSEYEADDPKMFTYLYNEQAKSFEPVDPAERETTEIPASSFVKFFEHPIEWYYKNILNIYYRDDSDSLPETEHFELNKLEQWIIKNDLLRLPEEDMEAYLKDSIMEGKLPLKTLGELTLEKITEEISEMRTEFNNATEGLAERSIPVLTETDSLKIKGKIGNVYGRKYVAVAFSDNLKYRIRAFMEALMLSIENEIDSAELLYIGQYKKFHRQTISVMDPVNALKRIEELLKFFIRGMKEPVLFSSSALKKVMDGEETENIFLEEAFGNPYKYLPANKYLRTLYQEDTFLAFDIIGYNKNDFDEAVYDEPVYNEIRELIRLLELKNEEA